MICKFGEYLHEPHCVRNHTRTRNKQRPEIEAFVTAKCGEDEQQQFERVVDRERAAYCDGAALRRISAVEEGGGVLQVNKRLMNTHIPRAFRGAQRREDVSLMFSRLTLCAVVKENGTMKD